MKKKIGVYVCHCGNNIADYVDVEKVKDEIAKEDGVLITKTTMFACADSTQKEIVDDIKEHELDGLIIASCSPKLHLFTFRNVAERAGLNPYNYVQANIREQVSWAHSDNPKGATDKAIQIIKGALAKVKLSEALTPPKISATNVVLVVGAGIAGIRAAIALADMGTHVYLIENQHFVGGRTSQWSRLFETNESGEEVITRLFTELKKREKITLFTGTSIASTSGSVGNFEVKLKVSPRLIKMDCVKVDDAEFDRKLQEAIDICPVEVPDDFNFNITTRKAIYKNFKSEFPECPAIDSEACTRCGDCEKICDAIDLNQKEEFIDIKVGAVLLATGFDPYEPPKGEYGYGEIDNVITLPQFKRLIELDENELIYKGKKIKSVAYIYCVGSRQVDGDNKYCSRYCCTSAIHSSIHIKDKYDGITAYHFNRGIRTYGKQELLYKESSENGDIYLQFDEDNLASVSANNGKTIVKANDILTAGKEFEAEVDLVVLVTGMTPRAEKKTGEILKVPIGRDKFFNEIHLKLKPVETVIDGVFISGACQAPFNITEAVKSSLLAASKANTLLNKGEIELEPTLAKINKGTCDWCDECTKACPYDAILKTDLDGKAVAEVIEAKCKGCGMCLPVCPVDAIELIGYSNAEIESIIDAMIE